MRADGDGFAAAYDQLFVAAWTQARRIVDVEAEDVAAETMVRAYVHWRRIANQDWRTAWVLRVATNIALNTARRSARTLRLRPITMADPHEVIVLRGALVAALWELPRRQREVVALRYLADASEHDVAEALGVRPVTVRTHLQRGLAALRISMGPQWEEHYNG